MADLARRVRFEKEEGLARSLSGVGWAGVEQAVVVDAIWSARYKKAGSPKRRPKNH